MCMLHYVGHLGIIHNGDHVKKALLSVYPTSPVVATAPQLAARRCHRCLRLMVLYACVSAKSMSKKLGYRPPFPFV
jgi:hypothetical protein